MTTRASRRHALLVATVSVAALGRALARRSDARHGCGQRRTRIFCDALREIPRLDCPTPRCGGWADPTGHAFSDGAEPPWYIEARCKHCDESFSRWSAATDELVERLRRDGACSTDDASSRESHRRRSDRPSRP